MTEYGLEEEEVIEDAGIPPEVQLLLMDGEVLLNSTVSVRRGSQEFCWIMSLEQALETSKAKKARKEVWPMNLIRKASSSEATRTWRYLREWVCPSSALG